MLKVIKTLMNLQDNEGTTLVGDVILRSLRMQYETCYDDDYGHYGHQLEICANDYLPHGIDETCFLCKSEIKMENTTRLNKTSTSQSSPRNKTDNSQTSFNRTYFLRNCENDCVKGFGYRYSVPMSSVSYRSEGDKYPATGHIL